MLQGLSKRMTYQNKKKSSFYCHRQKKKEKENRENKKSLDEWFFLGKKLEKH